jgi:hypothetical protein
MQPPRPSHLLALSSTRGAGCRQAAARSPGGNHRGDRDAAPPFSKSAAREQVSSCMVSSLMIGVHLPPGCPGRHAHGTRVGSCTAPGRAAQAFEIVHFAKSSTWRPSPVHRLRWARIVIAQQGVSQNSRRQDLCRRSISTRDHVPRRGRARPCDQDDGTLAECTRRDIACCKVSRQWRCGCTGQSLTICPHLSSAHVYVAVLEVRETLVASFRRRSSRPARGSLAYRELIGAACANRGSSSRDVAEYDQGGGRLSASSARCRYAPPPRSERRRSF